MAIKGAGRWVLLMELQFFSMTPCANAGYKLSHYRTREVTRIGRDAGLHPAVTSMQMASKLGKSASPSPPQQPVSEEQFKYKFFTRQGNTVSAVVVHSDAGARVELQLSGLELHAGSPPPQLHWCAPDWL
ncbi:hypothetical protein HaLaN_31035, partial [Haematococcus lacustris]